MNYNSHNSSAVKTTTRERRGLNFIFTTTVLFFCINSLTKISAKYSCRLDRQDIKPLEIKFNRSTSKNDGENVEVLNKINDPPREQCIRQIGYEKRFNFGREGERGKERRGEGENMKFSSGFNLKQKLM